MIRQGDVYWVSFRGVGSEPFGRRPAVVIQQDRLNASAISTTIVAVVTTLRQVLDGVALVFGTDQDR